MYVTYIRGRSFIIIEHYYEPGVLGLCKLSHTKHRTFAEPPG